MKSMPWFRMYTDFLNDPKMISLAFEDQRHFIGVLALKSEGIIDQDCDAKILDRIVAQRLWVDYAIIDDVKTRLLNAGLIDIYWQPTAWDKRQCRSDKDESGAERQRRFRENHSNALRNGSVTLPEESRQEEIREEESKTIRAPRFDGLRHLVSIGVDSSVASDWITTRKAKKAAVTLAAINGVDREAQKAGISLADALAICCQRGWAGFKAEWVADLRPAQNKRPTLHDERAYASALLTGKVPSNTSIEQFMGGVSNANLIEGVCHAA